jgi:hypothetical protein
MRISLSKIPVGVTLCCFWFLILPPDLAAATPFDPGLSPHTLCEVPVSILRPTQPSVGMKEVEMRAEKLRQLSPEKLQKYLSKKVAPIVIGPAGIPYLLDHHHLARALILSRAGNSLVAEVKENWSKLSEPGFWAKMKAQNWVYLRDQTGKPISDPRNLPTSIEAMHDDPYRSLSWLVREQGGYHETDDPYAEFQWADFFRARIQLDNTTNALDQATAPAVTLAHSPDAHNLPGYIAAAADKTGPIAVGATATK